MNETSPQLRSEINDDTAKKRNFPCENCGRTFSTKGGRTNHQRKCKNDQNSGGKRSEEKEENEGKNETVAVVPNGKTDVTEQQNTPSLPSPSVSLDQISPTPTPKTIDEQPNFKWGTNDGKTVIDSINTVYEKIVFWRKNHFLLPTGAAGKRYINETTRLIHSIIDSSPLKEGAMKAIMIMPSLLLQKPSRSSKSKDHNAALKRRMDLWENGDINELMIEGETIQQNLKSFNGKKTIEETSKRFIEKMSKGNINDAIKLLTNKMENGILPLNEQTLQMLKQKHPESKDAPTDVHVHVHEINAELIKKLSLIHI